MKFNNEVDRDTSFTVVVNYGGNQMHSALCASEPLTAFKDFPTFNQQVKGKKENWFNPKQISTQFIYKHLGEPDDKSFGQQIGVIKTTKSATGKLIKKYPTYTDVDFICAQVLSKVHDSVGGKMDTVTFSYKSNELEFNAEWHYGKNRFVAITD